MSNDMLFRVPDALAVTAATPRRVLVVGSCLVFHWPSHIYNTSGCHCDYVLANNAAQLPEQPPQPLAGYDMQIVQVPLRSILPDGALAHLAFHDIDGYQRVFDETVARLSVFLHQTMRWNREGDLLTFVLGFLVPQLATSGRLLPRHDLRNTCHFMERLNQVLAEEVAGYTNAHVFDLDAVAATHGKKYFLDDVAWADNHGALLSDNDANYDRDRMAPVPPISTLYPIEDGHTSFMVAVWAELLACYRTIQRTDAIKLVIVDLDDTLWRGVIAEAGQLTGHEMEGWPLGLVDALVALQRRGLLLAIASKNDEARIRELWPHTVGRRLPLERFAVTRIGWQSKIQSIGEILETVGVLPSSALFIDDNPAEREAVAAAFPAIRVLGANPYAVRRILLWSAETQTAHVSAESAARTEMVQAQAARETVRAQLSSESFLETLGVSVSFERACSADHPCFNRAFELLNKTNQFNTTGERWTREAARPFFQDGGAFLTWSVADRFTSYGLVGVAVLRDGCIVQMVMSCRVLGLDVETRAMAEIERQAAAAGAATLAARFVPTAANAICSNVFAQAGFAGSDDGRWIKILRPETAAPAAAPADLAPDLAPTAAPEAAVVTLLTGDPAAIAERKPGLWRWLGTRVGAMAGQ